MWEGRSDVAPYQRRRIILALVLGAILVTGLGLVLLNGGDDDEGEDIFLEGKDDIGPNPYTTIALSRCPEGFEDAPAGSQDECVPVTATTGLGVTTTALFGGSGDQRVCDPEALIEFLRTNRDKAEAWVEALNADPTLEWSGGDKLTVGDIPTYIRELTPAFLTEDTRVTNHGYVNGQATPRQSVLQKGTAVLVDDNGIPRTRCACGNPLTPPHKVDDPHYVGECWEGCHDRPYCSPPGCFGTTTTSPSSSTSTTACPPGVVGGQSGCEPPPNSTTTPPQRPRPTTTTRPPTTTSRPPATTTTTLPPTTTTSPNDVTSTTGQPPGIVGGVPN